MLKTKRPKRAAPAKAKHVQRILNCLPSPQRERDWPVQSAFDAGLVAAAAIPSAKDLRDDSWWQIGDQGSTGSCVGWATADSVIRWHFVKSGRIEKSQRLSVRYVWMAAKETDQFTTRPTTFIESDGTSLKAALDIARRYGIVPETELDFESGDLYGGDVSTFYGIASTRRISSYFGLSTSALNVLASWRKWIATCGPILTRLDVDSTWMDVGGDGELDRYDPGTAQGGHAVALVGYTSKHFIVRNSWGTSWGDGGYAYASIPYAIAAFTEAYGVLA